MTGFAAVAPKASDAITAIAISFLFILSLMVSLFFCTNIVIFADKQTLASMFISSSEFKQQFIPVNGIVNARDLGGYIMQDGRRLRDGAFIRAAHLADATDADLEHLSSIPIAKVIDFRKDIEMNGKTDRLVPGAEYIRLEIDASGKIVSQATEDEKKLFTGNKQFDVKKFMVMAAFNPMAQRIAQLMYPNLTNDPECQKQFSLFFRLILETENGAILYHCTQGKDRAGVGVMLVLSALGVSRDTIMEDYLLTNTYLAPAVERVVAQARRYSDDPDLEFAVRAFEAASEQYMRNAWDSIDRNYGSTEAYLENKLAIGERETAILREKYLL